MPTVLTLEGAKLPSYLTSTRFNAPLGLGNAVGDFILKQNPLVAALAAAALAFGGGLALAYGAAWGGRKLGLSGPSDYEYINGRYERVRPPAGPPKVRLRRIRLNSGGYEYGKHGQYYGNNPGENLYNVSDDDNRVNFNVRAANVAEAKRRAIAQHPSLRLHFTR